MHKRTLAAWSAAVCLLLTGCAVTAEEMTGEAQGYGGPLRVKITMDGERLTGVTVVSHNETQGVGTRAIDALPAEMSRAGTWEVDGVSGATVTSDALKAAVRSAMGLGEAPAMTDAPTQAQEFKRGVGMSATGRVGPGTGADGAQVYSFNVVFAGGVFDQEGRVVKLAVDQLEVLSANAEGEGARFDGFPGEEGAEDFLAQVAAWNTKRDQGEGYQLPAGAWHSQMDRYEQLFEGKTITEIEDWFVRFCSDETGRPLKSDAASEADQAKYAALSTQEQAELAEVTSSATISLRDGHGDILTAIRRAWENAR